MSVGETMSSEESYVKGRGHMFGVGECRDRNGSVRLYQNLKKGLPENIKFAIDENASIVLAICIMVFSYL
jgi:hypothetical protein